MSGELEQAVARALLRSIIERLAPDQNGNFTVVASASDVEAMRLLAEISPTPEGPTADQSVKPKSPRFGAPAIIHNVDLDLGALDAKPDLDGAVLAIDFGTAYSKASVWKPGASEPTPLPLRDQVSATSGLMLDSSLYVTDGVVYFGAEAQDVFRRENAAGRKLFDSPKGELSLLKGANLGHAASLDIDPTGTLSKRDLLTLYLAYMMGATSSALELEGISRHARRRYAVPVWNGGKLSDVSTVLRKELVDAQVLADSLPMEAWRIGLSVEVAEKVLRAVRSSVTDDQRLATDMIEGHVLEAAAAAAAISEKLADKRPVALVLDIGAGTTDVGLYQFALPSGDDAKVFPFGAGQGASTYAGNMLDQQLMMFIKGAAGVDAGTSDGQRVAEALSNDIRTHKATLFQVGFVDIEELDGRRFHLADFIASSQAGRFRDQLRAKITEIISPVGASKMKAPDGMYGVVTGGGANASLFQELFDEPFVLEDGTAKFEPLVVQPNWIEARRPELKPIFPQLAVAVGACSPYLPDERSVITDASAAPVRVVERFR